MRKEMSVVLSISALVVALAVPLMAQSMRLTADIPFEFVVAGKSLPAGEYDVSKGSTERVLLVRPLERGAAAAVPANLMYVQAGSDPAAETKLVFSRYGNSYFLSEVHNGYTRTGFTVPMSKAERELMKTASAQRFEVLATMARR